MKAPFLTILKFGVAKLLQKAILAFLQLERSFSDLIQTQISVLKWRKKGRRLRIWWQASWSIQPRLSWTRTKTIICQRWRKTDSENKGRLQSILSSFVYWNASGQTSLARLSSKSAILFLMLKFFKVLSSWRRAKIKQVHLLWISLSH